MDDQPPAPLSVPPRTAPAREPGFAEPRLRPSRYPELEDGRPPDPPPRSLLRRVLWWLFVLAALGGLAAWLVYRAGQAPVRMHTMQRRISARPCSITSPPAIGITDLK